MKFGRRHPCLFTLALLLAPLGASAQSLYTATQAMSLSAWGGATGTFVNLPESTTINGIPVVGLPPAPNPSIFNGGKNLGISAGVDLRISQFYGFLPSVEIRGTYPFAKGNVAGEENALIGAKIERPFGRLHPYADFFFGRGEIAYQGHGYVSLNGQILYLQTFSNVLSPGGGVDIDISHHYAAKIDAQLWHQSVPVTASGSLNSLAITAGAIYRFDFNHPLFSHRDKHPAGTPAPASTSP